VSSSLRIRLHPAQMRAWRSRARVVAAIAGSGGGKTWLGVRWLYARVAEHPCDSFFAVSPSYKMLTRVVLPSWIRFVDDELGLARAGLGVLLKGEMIYRFRTGAVVHFASAERPYSIEGLHARAGWLDEAGQMPLVMYEVARRRLAYLSGQLLITTTPYSLNWLKTEVYDRWKAGDPDIEVVQWASVDNPAYPREEFERMRRTLPEWKFRMFFLGEFTRPEGLVYPPPQVVDPFPVPPEWPRYAGLDLGYHNPTAAVLLARDPDGVWYAIREYYERERLLSDHARALLPWAKEEGAIAFAGDPSAAQELAELRRLGLPVVPAPRLPVRAGIDAVHRLVAEGRLKIFRGLTHLLDEWESYRWETRGEEVLDEPHKENDHLMDALRYAITYAHAGAAARLTLV
jgi:PBSX family phage terminase large subunit